jgi:hypothetical protein
LVSGNDGDLRYYEMSLNPFLHPRNPYLQRPNFKDMAIKDPDFR